MPPYDYQASLLQMVEGLVESGHLGEAIQQVSRLVACYPGGPSLAVAVRVLRLAGCLGDAERMLEEGLKGDPDSPELRVQEGLLWEAKGDLSRALETMEAAFARHPGCASLASALGWVRFRSGRSAEGLTLLRQAVAMDARDPESGRRLGEALLAMGQLPMACVVLGKVLEGRPEDWRTHQLLVAPRARTGRMDLARTHAVSLLRHGPDPKAGAAALASLAAPALGLSRHPREVLFVGDVPRTRVAKLGFGLRQAGWRTVLLHRQAPNFRAEDCFDEIHAYEDPEEALALARTFRPRVLHAFSVWSEKTSVRLIEARPAPVVYDCYDTVASIRDPQAEREVPDQRFCLEHADALCCRDLRPQYLKALGYRLPRRILFQEYCWRTEDEDPVKDPFPEDEIHVVSSGSFSVEKLGQTDVGMLRFARLFADQGIHFHLFPSPLQLQVGDRTFEDIFSDYLDLGRETGLVHMHRPLDAEDLARELRRHTVAINAVEAITFGAAGGRYDPASLRYNAGARLFEFLEAGLPYITNRELRFAFHLFGRCGQILDATLDNLRDLRSSLAPLRTEGARARSRRARAAFSLEAQIPRLTAFYEGLR